MLHELAIGGTRALTPVAIATLGMHALRLLDLSCHFELDQQYGGVDVEGTRGLLSGSAVLAAVALHLSTLEDLIVKGWDGADLRGLVAAPPGSLPRLRLLDVSEHTGIPTSVVAEVLLRWPLRTLLITGCDFLPSRADCGLLTNMELLFICRCCPALEDFACDLPEDGLLPAVVRELRERFGHGARLRRRFGSSPLPGW